MTAQKSHFNYFIPVIIPENLFRIKVFYFYLLYFLKPSKYYLIRLQMREETHLDLQAKCPSLLSAFNQNCVPRQMSVEVPNIKFNKNASSGF